MVTMAYRVPMTYMPAPSSSNTSSVVVMIEYVLVGDAAAICMTRALPFSAVVMSGCRVVPSSMANAPEYRNSTMMNTVSTTVVSMDSASMPVYAPSMTNHRNMSNNSCECFMVIL